MDGDDSIEDPAVDMAGGADSPVGTSPLHRITPEDGERAPLLAGKGGSSVGGAVQVSATSASGGATARSSTAQDLLKSSIAVGIWYTSNIGCVLLRCAAHHLPPQLHRE